jgi:pimeloyl-ACP methyl ester carboxylesterase
VCRCWSGTQANFKKESVMQTKFKEIPDEASDICASLCQFSYDDEQKAVDETIKYLNVGQKDVQWFDVTATGTIALLAKKDDTIYLAFQGTLGMVDVGVDITFDLIPYLNGDCHRGFLEISQRDYPTIGAAVKDLVRQNPKARVVVTGHSLGGALAMVYCALFKSENSNFPIDHLITFGQPRTGNGDFIKAFNEFSINYIRFVNVGDPVPDVPPPFKTSNWTHGGIGFEFESQGLLRAIILSDEQGLWPRIVAYAISLGLIFAKEKKVDLVGFLEFAKSITHAMAIYRANMSRYLEKEPSLVVDRKRSSEAGMST